MHTLTMTLSADYFINQDICIQFEMSRKFYLYFTYILKESAVKPNFTSILIIHSHIL